MKVNSNKAQSMQDVLKQLEDGGQAVFTSENYISFLKMMAQFHNYCPRARAAGTMSRFSPRQTKRLRCWR